MKTPTESRLISLLATGPSPQEAKKVGWIKGLVDNLMGLVIEPISEKFEADPNIRAKYDGQTIGQIFENIPELAGPKGEALLKDFLEKTVQLSWNKDDLDAKYKAPRELSSLWVSNLYELIEASIPERRKQRELAAPICAIATTVNNHLTKAAKKIITESSFPALHNFLMVSPDDRRSSAELLCKTAA